MDVESGGFNTQDIAAADAMRRMQPGNELWIHQDECLAETSECTCQPERYVMDNDGGLQPVGPIEGLS